MTTALAPTPPTTAGAQTTAAPPTPSPTPSLLARRRFTVAEYCAMAEAGILSEDERAELLDGEILVMAPIGAPHESGADLLNGSLTYRLHGRARVRVQGSVRLNDYSLPQPDIAVLRLRDNYHRERATAEDVLLLIEVADASLEFDREVKLARYAAAGIPEVWIVNVPDRQVEAYDDPAGGTYRRRRLATAEGIISPRAFPDVALAVADFLLP